MKTGKTNIKPFGTSATGELVEAVTLDNGVISCEILTFGAAVRTLLVPDSAGVRRDIVLGYDTLREYETQDGYLGAAVGRFANRISKGRFALNGSTYELAANDGENHLHGGIRGFSHRVWSIEDVRSDKVTLGLLSKDGEEGYPGNMSVRVTYALAGTSLAVHYEAVSDADTICNLTNHSYFNLSGHSSGPISDQEIMINAQFYTPTNDQSIPTGAIETVSDTPMDLRSLVRFDSRFMGDFLQLKQAGGFDHNFVIDGKREGLCFAAEARSRATGIVMRVDTTLPGIQLYTANFLSSRQGKNGCVYDRHHAFCLETQFYPDAPNRSDFPSPVLRKNVRYDHSTLFTFSTECV